MMKMSTSLASLSIPFCMALIGMLGCNNEPVGGGSGQEPPVAQQKLEGVLLRHPDAHTKQSMLTGNYHVKTDDGKLHMISPTENVSEEEFDLHHEKKVRVFGKLVEGEPWDGSDEMQGPSLAPGETWKWPDSFHVEKLEAVE